jgi:hypothetical protein
VEWTIDVGEWEGGGGEGELGGEGVGEETVLHGDPIQNTKQRMLI